MKYSLKLVSLILLLILVVVGAARAATWTVCSSGCDYASIQDAVDHASPGDVLDLAAETFVETVVVDRDLTIQGAGRGATVIDGNASGSVIVNEADLNVRDLTIRNGLAEMGGGVKNLDGRLSLTGCEVRDNVATDRGGGIHNVAGEVVITTNLIVGNSGNSGGGISVGPVSPYAYPTYGQYDPSPDPCGAAGYAAVYCAGSLDAPQQATLIVSDSEIRENTGGGVQNVNGEVVIEETLIEGNRSAGGVSNLDGRLSLTGCEVRDNAGWYDVGGVYSNGGEVVITTTVIAGNRAFARAGGIGSQDSDLTLSMSTVTDNYVEFSYGGDPGGIGVSSRGGTQALIVNSTIAGNVGDGIGGIRADSAVTIRSSTISHNSPSRYGYGYYPAPGGLSGSFELTDSIVADNVGLDCDTGTYGSIISHGNNLSSDATCGFAAPGDMENTDPLLLPLADNGGPTPTCAPQPDSPVIDAGGDTCRPTDQRGFSRPQDGDGDGMATCDIGAYEFQPPAVRAKQLTDAVTALGLPHGTQNALLAKLNAATFLLTDVVKSNDRACANIMGAFINQVETQRGRKIPTEDADALIEAAQEIVELVSDARWRDR